jgi:hypothetical protein
LRADIYVPGKEMLKARELAEILAEVDPESDVQVEDFMLDTFYPIDAIAIDARTGGLVLTICQLEDQSNADSV